MGLIKRSIKNITRRKTRTALVIIALSLSMALMISIPATLSANQQASQKATNAYIESNNKSAVELNKTSTLIEFTNQSNGGISISVSGSIYQPPLIDQAVYDEIRNSDKVAAVIPHYSCNSEATVPRVVSLGSSNFTVNDPAYVIKGIPLNTAETDSYSQLPDNITSGRNLRQDEHDSVVISQELVGYFHAQVGDKITINNRTFTVVGICGRSTNDYEITPKVYMNIVDAQEVTNKTGQYSSLDVYTKNTSDVEQLIEYIKAKYPSVRTVSYKDRLATLQSAQQSQQQMLNNAAATLAQTQATANQEIAVIVVATSTIVFFVMLYTVRERTKEIGTLKAIGFSNGQVMTQFMVEGVIQSAVAGAIGVGIGFFVAPLLSGLLLPYVDPLTVGSVGGVSSASVITLSPSSAQATALNVSITPELVAISMGTAILLGLLGSIYPAWKAAKTRPALAMKYE